MLDFFDKVQSSYNEGELQLWSYVAEASWHARKKRIFEGQVVEPNLIFKRAKLLTEDFTMATKVEPKTPSTTITEVIKSSKPP